MSSQPRSRFTIRRRILEVLLLLWLGAYFAGVFKDQQEPSPSPAVNSATPVPLSSPLPSTSPSGG